MDQEHLAGNSPTSAPLQQLLNRLDQWLAHPLAAPLLLLLIILIGLLVRYEDLGDWHDNPARGLAFGSEYYTTTFDGYYYFNIARDIAEQTPGLSASLKGVPDYKADSYKVPLLSLIVGLGSRYTGIPVHHLGALLIPLLGVLLAFPVYHLGRILGGRATGLTAALFSLCVPFYVYRSAVGWFDTDALNLFFATLPPLLFARFGLEQGLRRYLYYLYGLVSYLCFLWWWDMAPGPVTAITFLPLVVVLAFHYRAPIREVALFAGVNLALLVGVVSFTSIGMHNIIDAFGQLRYIAKETGSDFPSVGVSISEQSTPTLDVFIRSTSGEAYIMVLALIGLGFLVYRKRTLALVIAAPVVLSIFSVVFAQRFLIFLAPVVGIGIGYLVQMLWDRRKQWRSAVLFAPLLTIGVTLPNLASDWKSTRLPRPSAHLLPVLDTIKKSSPQDAVIWAWWDYAYPIMYWSQRATLADGSYHEGERMVYLGYPLTVSSPRLSANFMHFFAVRGKQGMHQVYQAMGGDKPKGLELIKQLLKDGPEAAKEQLEGQPFVNDNGWGSLRWLSFFYPDDAERRPIYLLLNREMMSKAYWWFWFGSWQIDRQDGQHPVTTRLIGGLKNSNGDLTDGRTFYLNTSQGKGEYMRKPFAIHRISQFNKGRYNLHEYPENPKQAGFTYYPQAGIGVLYDGRIAESVYGKLYLASGKANDYFKPVVYQPGGAQVWQVNADQPDKQPEIQMDIQ